MISLKENATIAEKRAAQLALNKIAGKEAELLAKEQLDTKMATEGAELVGKNAPAGLRGQTVVLKTV